MPRRALSFGSAAAAYERFRFGYPDEVVTAVLDYARLPVRDALEIGAGTGKATRMFTTRGIAVTATEPDAAMLAELRAQSPDSVTAVQTSLEDLRLTTTFDLVYAAAALHWTDPAHRWERIARLLVPGGTLASFGGPIRLADGDVDAAARRARAPWLGDDDVPSPDGTPETDAMQWPGTELQRCELFTDVRQIRIAHRRTVSAADYVGLLSTVSAYLQLPDGARHAALNSVRNALPAEVDVVADVDLHLARRV